MSFSALGGLDDALCFEVGWFNTAADLLDYDHPLHSCQYGSIARPLTIHNNASLESIGAVLHKAYCNGFIEREPVAD